MTFPQSGKNTVKRGAKKATYDSELIYQIVDAVEICHVAFLYEGQAMVQPINFGRLYDTIFVHGSHQNRMTQAILDQDEVCVNMMLLDSMKITRSAYHHSVNFRSVVLFGKARELQTHEEKLVGLQAIINHFIPNRWDYCRPPNAKELDATRVIAIDIETASAKIATAPPMDNKEDLALDYWSGEIAVKQSYGYPVSVENLNLGIEIPKHILKFLQEKNGSKNFNMTIYIV